MFFNISDIEENNKKVYDKASPQQRAFLDAVKREVDLNAKDLDNRLEKEGEVRAQLKKQLNLNLNISDAEEFVKIAKEAPVNQIFHFKNVRFIKSPEGNVTRAETYTVLLEKVIIEKQQVIDEFTNLGFFDLIKLAFTKLFKRS